MLLPLFVTLSILIRCMTSENSVLNTFALQELPQDKFHAFHSCMLGSGFRFEDLPLNSRAIRDIVFCCSQLIYPGHYDISQVTDPGVDGRDTLSMSPNDFQIMFDIDAILAQMICSFIGQQLRATPPPIR